MMFALELEATLERLTNEYQKAIEEKMRCQREADETTKTIQLANRESLWNDLNTASDLYIIIAKVNA